MFTSISHESTNLARLIDARQTALELSDQDLCTALGFERSIALALIKAGTMNFPLNKIPVLAEVLDIDPTELLRGTLQESSPDLFRTIEEAFNPLQLTATEVKLIQYLRELSGERTGGPVVFPGHGIIALVAA
ncbi:MAG: hypothetical protein K9J77_12150 [Rhodoferax sp.]|nr:hypothetical protein [Rhodoferax sp.]